MHVEHYCVDVIEHVWLSCTAFVDDSSRRCVRLVSRESGVRRAANHRGVPQRRRTAPLEGF